jgi:hypothetical protein
MLCGLPVSQKTLIRDGLLDFFVFRKDGLVIIDFGHPAQRS